MIKCVPRRNKDKEGKATKAVALTHISFSLILLRQYFILEYINSKHTVCFYSLQNHEDFANENKIGPVSILT